MRQTESSYTTWTRSKMMVGVYEKKIALISVLMIHDEFPDPDMLEYNALCAAYVNTKELRSQLTSQSRQISKQVDNARREIKELERRADEIQNIRSDD